MTYQGSLQLEKYLEEATGKHPELATGDIGGFKLGKLGVPMYFQRDKKNDNKYARDTVAYKFTDRNYSDAITAILFNAKKKIVNVVLDYSSEDMEQWTADVMPKGTDEEDPKNQDKYWNKPFEKEVKNMMRQLLPGFKVDIGG